MSILTATSARVYVGTYGKYNNGSIDGRWLELEQYDSKEGFLEACAELHADEHDPEFMFQDFEGIPDSLIGESHVDDGLWDWLTLDNDERDTLAAYREIDSNAAFDDARDALLFVGDSFLDYAYECVDEGGMLADIPEHVARYFDYDAYARDLEIESTYVVHDGRIYIFAN